MMTQLAVAVVTDNQPCMFAPNPNWVRGVLSPLGRAGGRYHTMYTLKATIVFGFILNISRRFIRVVFQTSSTDIVTPH